MPEVLQFKSPKDLADESLVAALMGLVECARNGEIHRMVCVCLADNQRFYKVLHNPADLSLVGSLSIVMDDLKQHCWKSSPCPE